MTHYRKVYKSDHLGVADLEDLIDEKHSLIFTIKNVQQFADNKKVLVAGKKINANIMHFVEPIKPWVVNATNGETMKRLTGSKDIEHWAGIQIQLYIDPTAKYKGETTGGVRISPESPKAKVKAMLTPDSPKWDGAVESVKTNGNADIVLEFMNVSDGDLVKLYEEAGVGK